MAALCFLLSGGKSGSLRFAGAEAARLRSGVTADKANLLVGWSRDAGDLSADLRGNPKMPAGMCGNGCKGGDELHAEETRKGRDEDSAAEIETFSGIDDVEEELLRAEELRENIRGWALEERANRFGSFRLHSEGRFEIGDEQVTHKAEIEGAAAIEGPLAGALDGSPYVRNVKLRGDIQVNEVFGDGPPAGLRVPG